MRLVEGLRDGFFVSILPFPVPTCHSFCLTGDFLERQNRLGNMAWTGLRWWWWWGGGESEGMQVGLEGVALWVLTSDLSKHTGRFTVQGAACVAV